MESDREFRQAQRNDERITSAILTCLTCPWQLLKPNPVHTQTTLADLLINNSRISLL